jgi:G3E family GTPase
MQPATEEYDSEGDDEAPLLVSLDAEAPPDLAREAILTTTLPTTTTAAPPCPVTILSGFLGSGKTTLIQYILRSPDHGKRIAVIENEFGEGLDVESMIARDGANNKSLSDLIELPNGCICCTVKDSLVTTLEILVEKRADLDYILIECSGMANPGPIASLFWLDDALESRLRLDGIVTLCDALHIDEQLDTTEEAAQQIAYADRILLNKMDLVTDDDQRAERVALIRQFHPTAPIRQTTYASVPDLDWLLDAHCFDSGHFQAVEESIQALQMQERALDSHHHEHSHDHTAQEDCATCQVPAVSHRHTSGITTMALTETGNLDWKKVNQWFASTLWPNQDASNATLKALIEDDNADHQSLSQNDASQRIFRMKGILSVRQSEGSDTYEESYADEKMLDCRRFILQSVHDLWDLYPASDELMWQPNEERTSKVVVIGKNLDEQSLREGFRACLK